MTNVKVYSTPTCPWCQKVKAYLQEKNIEFEDINVAGNPDKAREMVEKSKQMGVPVLDINGEIIIGFDTEKIDKALNEEK